VLEIERGGEEDLLSRSLQHQGWVGSHLHYLRRLYGAERIHPFRTPRAILLARRFSAAFLRKVADLPVSLTPLIYRPGPDGGFSFHQEAAAAPVWNRSRAQAPLSPSEGLLTPEEVAAGIHRSLRPHTCPPLRGYDIAGSTHPCRAVGGDCYDFLARSGSRLWVTVGDVAGKGHSAALIMTHFQAMLRGLARIDRPLGRLVDRLNDLLARTLPANEFISFFMLELDPEGGTLHYVNAGHNPPILLRASGEAEFLNGSGPVLGVVPGSSYTVHEGKLEGGDAILLYTDGATESQNPGQEEFGEERLIVHLREIIGLKSAQGVARLEQSILEFCGCAPRFDDITLLLVRRLSW
jgi:serine phosphatase RsbU (regulator of sigma subunit)